MKKISRIFFILFFCIIIFFSCMRVDTLINVKKDGSGTIELKMCSTKELAKMMAAFNQTEDEEIKEEDLVNLFPKEEFEKEAKTYGDVELVSYEEYRDDKYIGGTAVYKFKDISKVMALLVPDSDKDKNEQDGKDVGKNAANFKLEKKGKNYVLTVAQPEYEDSKEKTTEEEKEKNKEQINSMKNLLKDMYFSFKIKVDGKIVKTNAKKEDKDTVTLMDVDFNKILDNDKYFEKFLNEASEDQGEALKKFNNIDGVYYETSKMITIEFK